MPTIYKENGFNFYEINSKECSLGSKVTSTSGTAVDSTFSKECIIIPSRAGKYRVTEIGYKAFFEKTTIKRIKIKEGIKLINNNAFYGLPNLLLVIIPSSVEILGQWVISGYNNGQTATGTTTIIIGPNSKLKEIRAQGIERKDTYLIYFCGKKSPVTNGDPFFSTNNVVVYSDNQITIGNINSISDNGLCSTLKVRRTSCSISKNNHSNVYIIVFLLITRSFT